MILRGERRIGFCCAEIDTLIQMISLIYGQDFHLFNPKVSVDHEDYGYQILQKQLQFFGSWPISYTEIADGDRLAVLTYLVQNTNEMKWFARTTNQEISEVDKEFVLKIMKLDPRDRPTVAKLLADKWFEGWYANS
jgi:hypothetical protein